MRPTVNNLNRIIPERKTGAERFHDAGGDRSFTLLDFWQWSVSDLVSV